MLTAHVPPTLAQEREYAMRVILGEHLGLPFRIAPLAGADAADGGVRLSLDEDPAKVLRVADAFFASAEAFWLRRESLPAAPKVRWQVDDRLAEAALCDRRLPVLFGIADAAGEYFSEGPEGCRLGLDVFGSAFFALTRYEEMAGRQRDERGRYPHEASVLSRAGVLRRPIIDEYVEVLWAAMHRLWPRLARRERAFVERPSHDVDAHMCTVDLLPTLRDAVVDVVAGGNPRLAGERLHALRRVRRGQVDADLCHTFDLLMDADEARGAVAAFYFMAGSTAPALDATYDLDEPVIRRLLRRVHRRGHEVGLHPSYGTLEHPEAVGREFQRLREVCEQEGIEQAEWGSRQHYLRWSNPESWRTCDEAGLTYDSTLGYPDTPGFRCGTCVEYPAFDLERRRVLGLRERPLVAMDVALFRPVRAGRRTPPSGLLLAPDEVVASVDELRARCQRVRGQFTLLWHNTSALGRAERSLLRRVMDHRG